MSSKGKNAPAAHSGADVAAAFAALVFALVSAACSGELEHPGMRLLTREIYRGETLVSRALFDAPDREGPEDFWSHAGEEPFSSDDKFARVVADPDHPLQATLSGPVEIKIIHVNRVMTSASLEGLALVRSASGSSSWYLPAHEVARAKKAAGF